MCINLLIPLISINCLIISVHAFFCQTNSPSFKTIKEKKNPHICETNTMKCLHLCLENDLNNFQNHCQLIILLID